MYERRLYAPLGQVRERAKVERQMHQYSLQLDPSETQRRIFPKVFSQAYNFRSEYYMELIESKAADEPFDKEAFVKDFKEDTKEQYGRVNLSIFDAEAALIDAGVIQIPGFHAAFQLGVQVNKDSIWLPFFRIIRTVEPIPDLYVGTSPLFLIVNQKESADIWANLMYEEKPKG